MHAPRTRELLTRLFGRYGLEGGYEVISTCLSTLPLVNEGVSMLIARLLCWLALAAPAFAQETFPWIGQLVVTKYKYPIKVGDRVVPTRGFGVYRVQRAEGDRLWVVSEDVEGWIPSGQVVLFDRAIDFYTQEIRENPRNAAAWRCRGNIWDGKKEYNKAIADYNEAIRLDPKSAAGYRNRGFAWGEKEEYDKAIADYNEAIRLDPKDSSTYADRAFTWEDKKEYDRAIADYSQAIRLDSNDALLYYKRAIAWSLKKNYEKEIADYDAVIRLLPDDPDAYAYRAMAWGMLKKYDKWRADFNEAARLRAAGKQGTITGTRANRETWY